MVGLILESKLAAMGYAREEVKEFVREKVGEGESWNEEKGEINEVVYEMIGEFLVRKKGIRIKGRSQRSENSHSER